MNLATRPITAALILAFLGAAGCPSSPVSTSPGQEEIDLPYVRPLQALRLSDADPWTAAAIEVQGLPLISRDRREVVLLSREPYGVLGGGGGWEVFTALYLERYQQKGVRFDRVARIPLVTSEEYAMRDAARALCCDEGEENCLGDCPKEAARLEELRGELRGRLQQRIDGLALDLRRWNALSPVSVSFGMPPQPGEGWVAAWQRRDLPEAPDRSFAAVTLHGPNQTMVDQGLVIDCQEQACDFDVEVYVDPRSEMALVRGIALKTDGTLEAVATEVLHLRAKGEDLVCSETQILYYEPGCAEDAKPECRPLGHRDPIPNQWCGCDGQTHLGQGEHPPEGLRYAHFGACP